MITLDEIMELAKKRKANQAADHKHELEPATFNIEGHTVRGKICRLCKERFFLADDLKAFETELQSQHTGVAPISMEDAVLLLMGTYPDMDVSGALVMQKEMFLLEKDFVPLHDMQVESMEFIPYHMGPFSRKLAKLLSELVRRGLIEELPLRGREGTGFVLTNEGKRAVKRAKEKILPKVWEDLRRRRRAWDELGSQGLLRLVYEEFSAYAARSRIKKQIGGHKRED
ncbi:MAG: hypothetical protein WAS24_01825 [Thermoplasmata archaeon]